MAYDAAKDKEIKARKHEDGLYVSLLKYNGCEPKVQIGPRSYTKADESEGFGKASRLSMKEFSWLQYSNLCTVRDNVLVISCNR